MRPWLEELVDGRRPPVSRVQAPPERRHEPRCCSQADQSLACEGPVSTSRTSFEALNFGRVAFNDRTQDIIDLRQQGRVEFHSGCGGGIYELVRA